MKIKLERIGEPFHLLATNEEGAKIEYDAKEDIGGTGKGFRPMQAVASSLAACSSIDVLLILKKQKIELEYYNVSVEAERREEHPRVFTHIHLEFEFKTNGPSDKLERAVGLSVDKYCSVARMLESTVKITSSVKLVQ
ncbi:OsmC family protein [Paracrocinitomix mangrovi]|uniref:OsmC family protein n=1 Tax=Paracrocinitomix mangrovi TaxID=2862509 RepID=UPI001C8E3FC9|nr:OsmC family protein [Paracrocinitomix mangrovi]UKN02197.1 OsmC family protein [Paracrocinitomix mangrovi]